MADYVNASHPKKMLVYNLPEVVEPGKEVKVKQQARDPSTGEVKFMRSKKVICASLRVPWGATVSLTEKHLAVPEIVADLEAGQLKELKEAPKARATTAYQPPPAAEAEPKKKGKDK